MRACAGLSAKDRTPRYGKNALADNVVGAADRALVVAARMSATYAVLVMTNHAKIFFCCRARTQQTGSIHGHTSRYA
jgi:hypothetical protein